MSFNTIRENKILAKISEFTVVNSIASLIPFSLMSLIVTIIQKRRQYFNIPSTEKYSFILFSRRPFIRPPERFCLFLNILKSQRWKSLKVCIHIDIYKMYICYNKKALGPWITHLRPGT